MNQRINHLLDQAKLTAVQEMFEPELYKFAELIIQECLLSLEPNLYESDIEYRVDQAIYKRCARILLKHFGIDNERTS